MTCIYLTKLLNPKGELRYYFGIHSDANMPLWSRDHPEGYIGSSMAIEAPSKSGNYSTIKFLKKGWKHVSTEVLEEVSVKNYSRETEVIEEAWMQYGVSPEVRQWAYLHNPKLLKFPIGIVINCISASCQTIHPDGIPSPGQSPEAVRKRVLARQEYNKTLDGSRYMHYMLTKSHSSEASDKRSKSLHAYWISEDSKVHREKIIPTKETIKRGVATKRAKYGTCISYRTIQLSCTPEACKKMIASRTQLYKMSDGFVGTVGQIGKHYGFSTTSISRWLHGERKAPKDLRYLTFEKI